MTTVNSLTNNGSTSAPGAITPSMKAMTPDDFMHLFLAQLTHQDPMKPADSSTMLQQMTDISSIQATASLQTSLKDFETSMNATMSNAELMNATQLVGRNVLVASSISPLVAGKGLQGSIAAPAGSSSITVTIKDSTGQTVDTINLGNTTGGGLMDFSWDGTLRNPDGSSAGTAQPGNYNISAVANVGGKVQTLQTAGAFGVKSVAVDPQSNDLIFNLDVLGGAKMSDIIKYM